ncbi:MAG: family 43 glycosylhydrolase [Bacteroides sp.]|nr:family 43 glycosylhydrolase [Bacteroides sp.]
MTTLLCLNLTCVAQKVTFKNTGNPLVKHVHTADPAPMVDGDTLWLYAGQDEGGPDIKGYRMRNWVLFSTTDMVNWTQHPSPCNIGVFHPWAKRGKAYAAHCIKSRKDGKYYFYVSTNGPGIGVAVADSPRGPFKDVLGKPLLTTADCAGTTHGWACIDPAVFYDQKGQPWITWGNQKCYIAKLKKNMTEIDGKIKEITPEGSHFTEAPWVHYHDGLYYLTFANNWPETLGYAVSKRPDGPYIYKGVFSDVAVGSETTHPAFVEFKGQNLFFTHNGWMPGGSGSSRNVCVTPFEYNAGGTLTQLNVKDTLYWTDTAKPVARPDDCTAYLFAYFEGTGPVRQQEQLRFAVSENGTDWKALNGNLPVIHADSTSVSGGIRDPHILRGENNDFYMVMTDMMTVKNGWDRNTGVVLMKSDNLVDWTHSDIDLARDYPAKFDSVQWVWAPQTIWDAEYKSPSGEKGAYLVYFTVKFLGTKDDPADPAKSILDLYAAHTNRDFTAFVEEPYLMLQLKYGAIDEDIVYNPDDRLYHMFFKGNTKNEQCKEYINGIKQAVAPSLRGPWREDYRYVDAYAGKASVEGSGVFRLTPRDEARTGYKWCLMYDMYRDHRYEYQLSNDLFHFTGPKEFVKDFRPRHGTVMQITAEEYARLLKAFPIK